MTIRIVDFHASCAAHEFASSLKEIGFAVLSSHPIPASLIDQAYEAWFQFFHSERKNDFPISQKQDGFVPASLSETAKGYGIKDLKEFFHYYPWGQCPPELKELTQALYGELNKLAQTLLGWVEEKTPVEVRQKLSMPLQQMVKESGQTLFRILHYPALTGEEPEGAVRAAAHEDINLLTLLPAATQAGLQVKDSQGHWVDVPCNKGWIIVNTGDMLQECTQFYYPATTHRVLNPTGPEAKLPRMSMPLFLHPREEVRLSERYTADSFLTERLKELGLL